MVKEKAGTVVRNWGQRWSWPVGARSVKLKMRPGYDLAGWKDANWVSARLLRIPCPAVCGCSSRLMLRERLWWWCRSICISFCDSRLYTVVLDSEAEAALLELVPPIVATAASKTARGHLEFPFTSLWKHYVLQMSQVFGSNIQKLHIHTYIYVVGGYNQWSGTTKPSLFLLSKLIV